MGFALMLLLRFSRSVRAVDADACKSCHVGVVSLAPLRMGNRENTNAVVCPKPQRARGWKGIFDHPCRLYSVRRLESHRSAIQQVPIYSPNAHRPLWMGLLVYARNRQSQ